MGRWDRGVDFHEARMRILTRIARAKKTRSRCYAKILYLQLANGARISEAIRAAQFFSQNPTARKTEVLLSKAKNRKRLIVKPENLDFSECRELLEDLLKSGIRRAVKKVSAYAFYKLKINTHSLRYAFITRMLAMGVSPAIVAKVVGHAKLDHLITYTQKKRADQTLEELVASLDLK